MLKRLLLCSALAGVTFAGSVKATEAEFGTPDEARAMLIRAAAAMKADKTGAIDKFNYNDAQFRDRDLFVFCFNRHDGKFTAHEAFVGWDVRTLRDPNGKAFGAEIYADAQADRITEVSFTSPQPSSTKLAVKRAYVMRIGDQVCGVSAYQFNGQGSSTH
jgi:hypothetical protein